MSLDSNATLLPCPFCGLDDIEIKDGIASCTSCWASTASRLSDGYAAEAWNTRSQPSEWVATSERMPEPKREYLVCWGGYPMVTPEIAFFHSAGFFGRYGADKQPTHWMEIPSPPKPLMPKEAK